MEKQPRFFDEGDFTSAHEKIHLWTIEQFPKFNAYYYGTYIIKQRISDFYKKLKSYKMTLNFKVKLERLKEEFGKLKEEKNSFSYTKYQYDHDQLIKSFFDELKPSTSGYVGFKDPKNDIVIYLTPDNEEELIMKREHQLVEEIDNIENSIIKYKDALKKYQEGGWLTEHASAMYKEHCVMPEYGLEPVLKGYPPVYPDCILNIKYDQVIHDNQKTFIVHSIKQVVIEIKSHIDSFEPVMRQMQIYRSRLPSAIFMLIYPEKYSKYDTLFKSQDIEIVHCPDSLIE